MAKGLTYKAAGVDMEAGDALVDQIRSAVERTHGPRVVDLYGHFAGVFSLDFNERLFKHNYRHPMLVAGRQPLTPTIGSRPLQIWSEILGM